MNKPIEYCMTALWTDLILLANGLRRSNSTMNGTTNATHRTTLTKKILAASGGSLLDLLITTSKLPTAHDAPTITFAFIFVFDDFFSASCTVSSVNAEHISQIIINNGQKNAMDKMGCSCTLFHPTINPKRTGHTSIIDVYVVVTAISPFSR